MADDTTLPSTVDTKVKFTVDTVSFDTARKAIDFVSSAANDASEMFKKLGTIAGDSFDKILKTAKTSFNTLNELTTDQAKVFNLLTGSILGASQAFDSFANTNSLNSFSSDLKEVTEAAKKLGDMTGLSKLMEAASKAGMPIDEFEKFINAQAQGADAAIKQREGLIQIAAAAGNLNSVYGKLGPGLSNTGNVLRDNATYMNELANKTGLNTKQIAEYYRELGTIPGQLDKNIISSKSAGEKTSELEAALTLARGTGRDFKEVVSDISKAYENYNLTGEDALAYTARMSELSNTLGVRLNSVRDYMNGVSESFKQFGNVGQSSAIIFNDLFGKLKNSGVSTDAAMETVKDFTDRLKDLSVAQRAFLSAQTGGPGGLQGAFQIEKLIRDGKLDEVSKLVQQQLQKQIGTITTVDEAAGSQEAAGRLQKQNAILRGGPLGSFFKSDAEAENFAKALKEGKGR